MREKEENGFLFNVDILVKSPTNGHALQLLLQMLNSHQAEVADYRVKSGIELGHIIDAALAAKRQAMASSVGKQPSGGSVTKKIEKSEHLTDSKGNPVSEWIQSLITSNRLVRVMIETPKGRHSIPCRILNYLPKEELINVYHVDEKQVYTYKLSEIIDILDA
ncbi:hypothetical protein [Paenibacillus pinistramenti]|uniref:hypothetical protein n=1 Tax=Paenibacillus pinistramenti TaxID=1768003 RepID=UPI001EF06840|nr:hypothetical protein [Paenibacillus pinistramenti]